MKLPQPAIIEFLDHAQHVGETPDLHRAEVIGMIHKEDALCYYVVTWVSNKIIDINTEWFIILKSTITRITKLKRVK